MGFFFKNKPMNEVDTLLPTRLRYIRKLKGFTQEDVAERISATKGTVSNYETGYSSPTPETLSLLADIFSVSTDYLLGRTDIALGLDEEAKSLASDPQLLYALKTVSNLPDSSRKQVIDFIDFVRSKNKRD